MPTSEELAAALVFDKLMGTHKLWIEAFAASHNCTFDEVIEGAKDWLANGESMCFNVDIDYEAADEFWNHYEPLFAVKIDENKRESFFRCAC